MRAQTNLERLYDDVDDIVLLDIIQVSHDATDNVTEDDLTWVETYLRKMQLDD